MADDMWVLAGSDPRCLQIPWTGGKASSLAELGSTGVTVPPFFCVTTVAYVACVYEPALLSSAR
jgi:phosphoenolpyruvate synthase/pyruvate phosphate dikinase